jgi:peroxiredoxin
MYAHERSLVKRSEGKPFALVGINSDDKEALRKTIEKEKMTWRSFWDGGNTSGPIASKWNVSGWPTLYVVDAKGVIRYKWMGSPGDKVLDDSIEKLIAEVEGVKKPNAAGEKKSVPDGKKKDAEGDKKPLPDGGKKEPG